MKGGSANPVLIRPATAEDAGEIHLILAESPEAVLWSAESLRGVILQPNGGAFVSERGASMTGFVLGRQVADEAEILNLAVRKLCRRRGDGQRLVQELFAHVRRQGAMRVFLEVRESNANAIRFYEKLGFALTGKRPGYYRQPAEGALVLARLL